MEAKNLYKKKVELGQDIYDMCIQEYASLNALFLLLADNPSLDLQRQLIPGEELVFRIVVPVEIPLNKNLMDEYRTSQTRVNNHDYVQTLSDPCLFIMANGNTLQLPTGQQLALASCNVVEAPVEIEVGILTPEGGVLVTPADNILLPPREPFFPLPSGFSFIMANGNTLRVPVEYKKYFRTPQGKDLKTAEGKFLLIP